VADHGPAVEVVAYFPVTGSFSLGNGGIFSCGNPS